MRHISVREKGVAMARRDTRAGAVSARGEGWVMFAGIVLIVAGISRIFDAVWAFTYNGPVPDRLQDAIFGHSLTTYGWIYLVVAAILILSGWLVFSGSQVARWVGMIAGGILTITAIPWMPYYPIWSLTYVGLGVLLIYALAAYGGKVRV
jgi:hypothetical protein